ncbi:restriction endonuclease subunit S [Planktothrix agardhii]|uniref:restriction endonuclease subunit S n=1 Tax=Planktothrix agardhii TaxID=1160 RepID=UPI003341FE76
MGYGDKFPEIPQSWIWVNIGDIAEVKGGKRLPQNHQYSDEPTIYPYIRVVDFQNLSVNIAGIKFLKAETQKLINQYTISIDDLYISIAGSIGKVGTIPFQLNGANLTENAAKITSLFKGCDKKFLCYALNSNFCQEQIKNFTISTNQPKLALFRIEKIAVALPPLPEQYRIVAQIEEIFTELDAGVELLKKLKVKLKRYRQAVLKAAVEGSLTKEWREANQGKLEPASILLERILKQRREKWEAEQLAKMKAQGKTPKDDSWKLKYKEPIAPDTSELPELPDGWCWASLEAVADAMGGYAFKSQDYSENGCQILKIGNVKPGKISLDDKPSFIKQVDEEIKNKYLLNENDIVITLTGTRNKRDYGFVAIVNHHGNLLLNQRVARLRFNEFLNINFFSLALQSKFFQDNFFKHETGNVGQGNVGMNAITKELIFIPSILEQDKIFEEVERLFSVIDQLEKTIDSNLKRSEKLRQSILKQAFEGKLVPQDPNDEPAEKLLERIKAEKAKQTTTKTKKKTQSKKQSDLQLEIPLK